MGLFDAVRRIFTVEGDEYRCRRCGREFAYSVELSNLRCPYCDSADIERMAPSEGEAENGSARG
ncbi:hypothetical protein [Haladaptatus sp. NG-SE-30]